jgi:hypothetical protein
MKRERERERDNESANQVERRSPSSSMMALALGGDPVSRAVAVAALGRLDQATAPTEARLAVLQLVMRADRYPAVRRIAARSAARLAPLQSPLLRAFDPTGPAVERERALDAWVAALPALAGGRAAGLVVTWAGEPTSLRRGADEAALDIGE